MKLLTTFPNYIANKLAMIPSWDFDEFEMEYGLEELAKSGKNILED